MHFHLQEIAVLTNSCISCLVIIIITIIIIIIIIIVVVIIEDVTWLRRDATFST